MAFSKASSSISAEGRCFVYQDGLQHRVVYHVVYEDGDSEDLLLSQVLPLLAQASAAQGQVRGDFDEQKPSSREGKEEAVKKRTRPLSEAANNATEQQRGKGVGATHLPNDFTCAEPQVAPDTVSQCATHGSNRSCHQQPSAACCEGGRGARRRSSMLCCREVWC